MKTTEEMISVMKAYAEGKKIETRIIETRSRLLTCWVYTPEPAWDWANFDYRIKPEPKYRPYASAEECFKDVQKHGGWVKKIRHEVYLALSGMGTRVYNFNSGEIRVYQNLLDDYIWADDGSPCGVLEEE